MVGIVNFNMGNIKSIASMLRKIGANCEIANSPDTIMNAKKIILPGVGSFDTALQQIKALNLEDALNTMVVERKTPILGICLGMQLFAKSSEEGKMKGFGWIDGVVRKFSFEKNHENLKIPHMGWNNIQLIKTHALFNELPFASKFYFVHSYHFVCNEKQILATTHYGYDFPSIISEENIIGVQFHPEKSHKYGMRLLKNFVEM